MRIMTLSLLALMLVAGCNSTPTEESDTIGGGLSEDLVVDKVGRIIGNPTHLEAPDNRARNPPARR
ncbi:MAG: hypothetical protein ACYTDT_06055 [Planctomycetota bacterium]|jgi:hypothetical protein